jgi:hypothetical protein
MMAGDTRTADLQTRDTCNNKLLVGDEAAVMTSSLTPTKFPAPTVSASIVDNNDGTYTSVFSLTIANTYVLRGTHGGSPTGSTRNVIVGSYCRLNL